MPEPAETTDKPSTEEPPKGSKRSFWKHPVVLIIGAIIFGVLVYFGLEYLAFNWTHETTDDAFLDADVIYMAPQVAGQVKAVHFTDNQFVNKGDLLMEIDPRDYQATTAQKQAKLQTAQANVQSNQSAVQVAKTRVDIARQTANESRAASQAAEATAQLANDNLKRSTTLRQSNTISSQEFDQAKTAADTANANLAAARRKAAGDELRVPEAEALEKSAETSLAAAQAAVDEAAAELEWARLNLSYTKILAPTTGRIARKQVEPGSYVQVGQRLFSIVPEPFWVTANYKETQLQNMRPGQPAEITIDAYSGHTWAAHVDSIQPGSGAQFSLLPPENAVGNYVKVVQRVPVKIVFNEALPDSIHLGPGMSVSPAVRIKNFTIPKWLLVLAALLIAVLAWWIVSRVVKRKPNAEARIANPE